MSAACDACLRRAELVRLLAPFIEKVSARKSGSRVSELLALDDAALADAVAPKRGLALREQVSGFDLHELRGRITASGCWVVCRHDDRYPPGLRDARDAPAALFGCGSEAVLDRLAVDGTVTVVGSRRATGYGRSIAMTLASDLASTGLVVVSGLAYGIDVHAHRGAVETGTTVAVLAGGPDLPYPRGHRADHRRIIERDGAVISEFAPGSPVWRWAFPARNRIMAALAGMTVVVEAAKRSGSLITTEMASDLGREVGAVPGPVTSRASSGTNSLLADGACVVRGAEDVLEAMLGPGIEGRELRPLESPLQEVLDAVAAGHRDPDSIAFAAGLGVGETSAALMRLELLGRITVDFTGRCTAK